MVCWARWGRSRLSGLGGDIEDVNRAVRNGVIVRLTAIAAFFAAFLNFPGHLWPFWALRKLPVVQVVDVNEAVQSKVDPNFGGQFYPQSEEEGASTKRAGCDINEPSH